MRGSNDRSGELFAYVGIEDRLRPDHPLRTIRTLMDAALSAMSGEFAALYSKVGRPSIPPEMLLRAMLMLLRAMLLQAFYSVRSERQLMERLEFDLLFRWFVVQSGVRPGTSRPRRLNTPSCSVSSPPCGGTGRPCSSA